jgi:periplasmic divalent cation tolerance protein
VRWGHRWSATKPFRFWLEHAGAGDIEFQDPLHGGREASQSGGRIYKVLWLVNKKAQYGVNMGSYIVCLVTIDDLEKGAQIAGSLVERRLVACVNIVPQIRSIYSWKGQICDETEVLLIMKTRGGLFEAVKSAVKELHPYEVPEIVSWNIEQGLENYLKWIDDSTAPTD